MLDRVLHGWTMTTSWTTRAVSFHRELSHGHAERRRSVTRIRRRSRAPYHRILEGTELPRGSV